MKEIVLKVYKFDELSKDSQERIIERERWNVMEQCMDAYSIDYQESMKAFEDMTDTRVYGWEVGYERYDFSYEFKYKDPIYEHPDVQESIVKAMDKALERAIGNKVIDFEKCEGNYLDVYPLIGAVLQRELRSVLGENVNKNISRNMKIKATKYRNDYRVWLDYAGDYRNENIE